MSARKIQLKMSFACYSANCGAVMEDFEEQIFKGETLYFDAWKMCREMGKDHE